MDSFLITLGAPSLATIFSHLDIQDLLSLERLNKTFYGVCKTQLLWREFCLVKEILVQVQISQLKCLTQSQTPTTEPQPLGTINVHNY
jgi:hypothetical protein